MTIKRLFTLTAALSLINGLCYFFAPEFSLSLLGRSTNPVGIMNTRFFGAAALGISAITWHARKIQDLGVQRMIALGVLITLTGSATAGFIGTLSGAVNEIGWLLVAADSLLSAGFLSSLIKTSGSG